MQERKAAEASSGSNEEEDGADDAAPPPAKHMKTAQKKVSGKRKESVSVANTERFWCRVHIPHWYIEL